MAYLLIYVVIYVSLNWDICRICSYMYDIYVLFAHISCHICDLKLTYMSYMIIYIDIYGLIHDIIYYIWDTYVIIY